MCLGVEKKAPKIVPETLPMLSPVLVLSQQIQLLYKIGSGEQILECMNVSLCSCAKVNLELSTKLFSPSLEQMIVKK